MQQAATNFHVHRIIFNQQHPNRLASVRHGKLCATTRFSTRRRRTRERALVKGGGEPESRANPNLTPHAKLAAHHRTNLFCDRKSQPGAAELAGGGTIGLGKGIENNRLLVGRNTYSGVRDLEFQYHYRATILGQPHDQPNLALVGEFHRIAKQIGQNLAQAMLIADQVQPQRVRQYHVEGEPLSARRLDEQFVAFIHDGSEIERAMFEFELAGLDLRQIQDIIDQAQQHRS